MEAKEKARELRDKMWLKIPAVYDPTGLPHYPIAKEMALIAIDEVLENVNYFINHLELDGLPNNFGDEIEYWQLVKEEINKL